MATAVLSGDIAPPFREAKLMPVDLSVERRGNGTIILKSRVAIADYDANIPAELARACARQPGKPALAWREAGREGWTTLTYTELKARIDAAAQWLIDNAPAGRPLLLIADNTPAFAIATFAAWAAGLPVCPVSSAYGALGGDYGRLAHVVAKVKPGVVFAENSAKLAFALAALDLGNTIIVTGDPAAIEKPAIAIDTLLATRPTNAVVMAVEAIKADDLAAYMLTSGSTGLPKMVAITFDNLAANSAQCRQMIGEAAGWHDVMLDWLPWHHAAGAFVLRTTLTEGGTLYIDDGKPMPGLFAESIRNLREIPVRFFNNVPLGYGMLVQALESDAELRRTFFSKLKVMLYGGAGLSQPVYDRLQAAAIAETGHRIMLTSGYGSTETVSAFMAIHFETDRVGIGLPAPGAVVKLVPSGDRYEVRAIGPNVTRGYLEEPAKNAEAFDEEGFYRTGDMAVFNDADVPEKGLAFAGRTAEEFKLSSGAWVYGGSLRDQLLKALTPMIRDLVLCDENREYLTLLLWPTPDGDRDRIAAGLAAFNAAQHGGSSRIRRALLLDVPPDPNAHEMSDKGTINRRAVIDRRKADVDRLYAALPDPDIIIL
ncbi:AMP-binding protein [Sphingomonas alpina]|uniref:AMP-binding protein n=1 Tax=Sphingomonas alpina TaxID=653931 RepID=A0A7H0LMH4_9SPHN|nr:AMP-binding protein [Sphingomonas alpina]QNQ10877.1 AMP-binding protein [Sphingomonas alpina]